MNKPKHRNTGPKPYYLRKGLSANKPAEYTTDMSASVEYNILQRYTGLAYDVYSAKYFHAFLYVENNLPVTNTQFSLTRSRKALPNHLLPEDFYLLPSDFHSLPEDLDFLPEDNHFLPMDFCFLPSDFHSLPADFHLLPEEIDSSTPEFTFLPPENDFSSNDYYLPAREYDIPSMQNRHSAEEFMPLQILNDTRTITRKQTIINN